MAAGAGRGPSGEGEAAQIEVLLGDIKGIFAEKAVYRIPSADLVLGTTGHGVRAGPASAAQW